jgi:hypothetical protein
MSKKTAEPMKVVLVEWLDAYTHDSGWKSIKSVKKQGPVLVRTVGFLVKEAEDHVTVAASHVPHDDHCDGDVIVPRGMIKSIVELKA